MGPMDGVPPPGGQVTGPTAPWGARRSGRRALVVAEWISRVVDDQLALVGNLPMERRDPHVERLAALLAVGSAHRHRAAGWIGRRELRRRSEAAFAGVGAGAPASC
jgi:hypothetical protein